MILDFLSSLAKFSYEEKQKLPQYFSIFDDFISLVIINHLVILDFLSSLAKFSYEEKQKLPQYFSIFDDFISLVIINHL